MSLWSNYWKKYRSETDSGQKKTALMLVAVVIGLFLVGTGTFQVGGYIKVLEQNKADLQSTLNVCTNQTQSLNSSYMTCNTSLNICNTNLSGKTDALVQCQNQKSSIDTTLSTCRADLRECRSDYDSIKSDLDSAKSDLRGCRSSLDSKTSSLNSCNSDLSSARSNFDALKVNFAKFKCCPQNLTHYQVSGNNIVCTNTTSDPSITC